MSQQQQKTQSQSQQLSLEEQRTALQKQLSTLQAQNMSLAASAQPGARVPPVRQSRILDRPPKADEKDSTLKIKIELDLEVEVDLYARVKGDVTIGLL
ncbi:hypothetical protein MMC15_006482 [Xylographa vitiligo]|nr:hypothetical protein [Xylographa vitiligo]